MQLNKSVNLPFVLLIIREAEILTPLSMRPGGSRLAGRKQGSQAPLEEPASNLRVREQKGHRPSLPCGHLPAAFRPETTSGSRCVRRGNLAAHKGQDTLEVGGSAWQMQGGQPTFLSSSDATAPPRVEEIDALSSGQGTPGSHPICPVPLCPLQWPPCPGLGASAWPSPAEPPVARQVDSSSC